MPRSKKQPEPIVVTGDVVAGRPPRNARPVVSVGVTTTRRPGAGGPRPRETNAFTAAEASNLFGRPNKGGGTAFVRWLQTTLDMNGDERLTAADWAPLLLKFASRAIHGHRRQRVGGNHRLNRVHRR